MVSPCSVWVLLFSIDLEPANEGISAWNFQDIGLGCCFNYRESLSSGGISKDNLAFSVSICDEFGNFQLLDALNFEKLTITIVPFSFKFVIFVI